METMAIITFGVALLGAVLGVINTWRSLDRDCVKLLVTPKTAIPVDGLESMFGSIDFCIEVINLSFFPLTISEVGFLHKGVASRAVVIQPLTLDGSSIPRKLGPREAITFYMDRPRRRVGHPLRCAYATTSCGHTFKGKSPALTGLAD